MQPWQINLGSVSRSVVKRINTTELSFITFRLVGTLCSLEYVESHVTPRVPAPQPGRTRGHR